ncbi:hypothetical protein PTTG_05108 [Puccinia triticina 1-1 BBBD Race 1]|uniref:Mtf2-like C-terminal domain-containing protein n=2 Tax=Puccinia triticina TaxID=208348 RepID=A0A180GG89_PUCT1|nr:hypothetical protein PTTG_05108 [Puccinia triticina 1-1 BBBD Race 1]
MVKLSTTRQLLTIRGTLHLTTCSPASTRWISTDTEPSSNSAQRPFPSSSKPSPSSSSAKKKGSRLRDRAGLPVFKSSNRRQDDDDIQGRLAEGSADNPGPQSFTPMKPWSMRTRNQLERSQMSHRESLIALELLEDLAIPLEELSMTTKSDPEQENGAGSGIRDLLHRPEFQSILSKHSSSNKSLSRHRPDQLSSEDLRIEDILKELSDSLIQKIDSMETDFELLGWLDQHVFSQSRSPSPSESLVEESSPSSSPTTTPPDQDPTPKLGQVFENLDAHPPIPTEFELDMNFDQDPETMLSSQPVCFTPLFSPILLHLLKTFSSRFKNPHLALYLFDWARSHSDPFVKYFGLTRDVYFESLQIKWKVFRDFRGIQNDMLEMKALGLEFDDRFKRLVQLITQVVLDDEIQAESRLLESTTSPPDPSKPHQNLDRLRRISAVERHYVSQIESLLNEFIESQNQAFTHKFRVPSPSQHQS